MGRFHHIKFEKDCVGIRMYLFFRGVIITANYFYLRSLGVYILYFNLMCMVKSKNLFVDDGIEGILVDL